MASFKLGYITHTRDNSFEAWLESLSSSLSGFVLGGWCGCVTLNSPTVQSSTLHTLIGFFDF